MVLIGTVADERTGKMCQLYHGRAHEHLENCFGQGAPALAFRHLYFEPAQPFATTGGIQSLLFAPTVRDVDSGEMFSSMWFDEYVVESAMDNADRYGPEDALFTPTFDFNAALGYTDRRCPHHERGECYMCCPDEEDGLGSFFADRPACWDWPNGDLSAVDAGGVCQWLEEHRDEIFN